MTRSLKSQAHHCLPSILTDAKSLLLTANQRLARFLNIRRAEYGISPAISLTVWVNSLWLEGQDKGLSKFNYRLLTDRQETFLWRTLLKDQATTNININTEEAVQLLQRARGLVDGWRITRTELAEFDSPETRFLLAHLALFEEHCHQHRLISLEGAVLNITKSFQNGTLATKKCITLYGFQDISPLLYSLLESATPKLIDQPVLSFESNQLELKQYASFQDEVRSIASACKTLLNEASAQTSLPTIGIIVPNLADVKTQIEDVFIREFAHAALSNPALYDPILPIDFSLGRSLIKEAVIADIPLCFTLLDVDIPLDELLNVCRSPFWGLGLTYYRWQLLDWLQQQSSARIRSTAFFSRYATICAESEEGEWLKTVIAFRLQLRRERKLRLSLPGQVERIKSYLQCLRWPGPRTINSREYQATSVFFDVLATLNSANGLHPQTNMCHLNTALGWLIQELSGHIFQAQKPSQAIQIMGIVEGSGLTFDHCFVIGLTEDVLPAKPSPLPLLPISLQRKLGTPRSSIQKEVEYGQKQMAAFAACSPHVELSYHHQTRDSQPVAISPLIIELAQSRQCIEGTDATQIELLSKDLQAQLTWSEFEIVPSCYGPPLTEKEAIPGGSNHIKVYGSNPFYAFCRYRLGVVQTSGTQLGLSHLDRGNLLHLCMANFWQSLQKNEQVISIHDLKSLGSEQLLQHLDKIIGQSVNDYIREQRKDVPSITINIEIHRLHNVILPWLDFERSRPNFSIIDIESRYEITIGDHPLVLRLDRLDKLETGELLVIDYKTGNVGLSGLTQHPLQEPQLPLYALAITPTPKALAFAKLRAQETELIGLGELKQGLGRISEPELPLPKEWNDLILHWQQQLENAAKMIARGHAEDLPLPATEARHFQYLLPLSRRKHLEHFFDYAEKNSNQDKGAK